MGRNRGLLIGLGSLLVLGGIFGVLLAGRARSGHVLVRSKPSTTNDRVDIAVDALPPYRLGPGQWYGHDVDTGPHTLRITAAGVTRARAIRVEGGDQWVVPVDDAQCFVEIDVSESAYGGSAPPRLVARHRGAPFRTSDATVLTAPTTRSEHQVVYVIRDVPCEELSRPDAELAAAHAD